ncbi:hypothetical protein DWB84_19025 [Saccharophagus sp. K07]|nr:hypothetical protein [Saccharophagus sp. K07]
MVFDVIIFLALVFLSQAIVVGIKTGTLHSAYGEAMTVRKSEGPIGYFLILFLYVAVWLWMAYLLFK